MGRADGGKIEFRGADAFVNGQLHWGGNEAWKRSEAKVEMRPLLHLLQVQADMDDGQDELRNGLPPLKILFDLQDPWYPHQRRFHFRGKFLWVVIAKQRPQGDWEERLGEAVGFGIGQGVKGVFADGFRDGGRGRCGGLGVQEDTSGVEDEQNGQKDDNEDGAKENNALPFYIFTFLCHPLVLPV